MATKKYTLDHKLNALDALKDFDVKTVSKQTGISASTLRKWQKDEPQLRAQRLAQLQQETHRLQTMVYNRAAEKALQIVNAMTDTKIEKAPLNQLSSALGVLVDRVLKLQNDLPEFQQAEKVIRFEFRQPDGTLGAAPYEADNDFEEPGTVQGGGVRQTVRQDGSGEGYTNGASRPTRQDDVVARPDLSNGGSSVAGHEDDDPRVEPPPR